MDCLNIVVVVSDTLRAAHLGCYGNSTIHTAHIDGFATQAVRFTRAYPESLPTIPMRRALHTGRRAYPFRNYRPLKWDIVYLPGWQPIANEEDTLAENLAAAGYQTGFVTDTLPYFAPGFNFERGFWQWEHVRGYGGGDRWASPYTVPRWLLSKYGDPDELMQRPHRGVPMSLANRARALSDEETATARLFKWGARFLEDNQVAQPFYLLIDSFAPHEPWEAPEMYYRLYGAPDYRGRRFMGARYGPADGYAPEEIEYIKAQYSGLVTHVDHWFGMFMHKLDLLGLGANTAVFFISDHGTNFCENPRNVIGKPEDSMYPGVMRLPFLVRLPGGQGAGQTSDDLVYDIDLTATVYDLAGIHSEQRLDGQSLMPLLGGAGTWKRREYVTCRYGHSLCYIDERSWVLTNVDGIPQEIFDLESDPHCIRDIKDTADQSRFKVAWERLLADAGGSFPDYRGSRETDAIGVEKA